MKLVVEQGSQGRREYVVTEPLVTVGRSAENSLVLLEHGVSRRHARLQRSSQGWLVSDQGSTNGTYVNGQRLPPGEPYLLRPGDRIAMGNAVLVFQEAEPLAGPEALPDDLSPVQQPRRVHPAVVVVGAVVLLAVLIGAVLLLVVVLRPAQGPPTPTAVEPLEQMMTTLPLPTGLDQIVTDVAPLLPTDLPLPLFGTTPTPTP